MQLDEVRRLSGSKASLPVVPEEEEEEPLPQPQSPASSQPDMAPNTAAGRTQQVSHAQLQQEGLDPQPQERRPDWAVQQERQQQHHQMLPDQEQELHAQQEPLQQQEQQSNRLGVQQQTGRQTQAADKSSRPHLEGSQSARVSKPDSSPRLQMQAPLNSTMSRAQGSQSARVHEHASSTRLQQTVQESVRAVQQQHHQLQHSRQPISPKPQNSRNAGSMPGTSSPPVQLPVAKASAKARSPVMAHAVEHSSMSLSQLAVASRSKLRPPSSVKSPPKCAGRATLPKQATNSHLAKLAAAVPLPASPNGAGGQSCLEDTAAVALATAVAKPSHIPAPAAKPSRLKKPTNTSGFFSSGRSFTGAGSNSR